MIGIIFISIFIGILLIGFTYSIYFRDKYEVEIEFAIVIVIYFINQALYFIIFNLATEVYFNIEVTKILWKLSIFIRIFSIGLWSSIHSVELHKHSIVRFLAIIIYFFLEGIIISLLFFPNSFLVIQDIYNYLYLFQDFLLLVFILIFNSIVIIFTVISQIMGFKNFNDKTLGSFFTIYICIMSLNTILYSIFLVTQNIIFRTSHIILYILNATFILYVIIRKPALFLVFTNKIYDFVIFHKSGILLYSYNFQTSKEVDDSLLKGSILIGINHILANFSGIENQLNHIKMSDKGIVFNFQTDLGYAVLLIARHKNKTLEKAVHKFIQKFSTHNKEKLLNLNGLIDVSIFKDTRKLITECFGKYNVRFL
jgi:hypothetical protein